MMVRLTRGVAAIVFGSMVASACVTSGATACTPTSEAGVSVARIWNETLLDAIRRDFPAPTVHARNLFHMSTAMWDAWAAYDPTASGYFVDEDQSADDVALAREEAMSYAAYRILRYRYATAAGVGETMADLDMVMQELCFSTDVVTTDGDSPAALGNRIAEAAISFGRTDGANERDGYLGDYTPSNPPLIIAEPGTDMTDPNHWQPLAFEEAIAQNGLPLAAGVQQYVGPHWGYITPFALAPDPDGV
ncbi:MAG: hypothetical protein OEO77_08820, partial [Acidimicrobiia bacterium]|nr:hypothetical protein [Acidimicrobiia bacterium]